MWHTAGKLFQRGTTLFSVAPCETEWFASYLHTCHPKTLGFWAKQASISKPGVGVSGFQPNCDIPLESCFKGEQLCQLSQPVKMSGSGVIRKRGAFGRGVVLGGGVLIVTIGHNAVTVPPRVGRGSLERARQGLSNAVFKTINGVFMRKLFGNVSLCPHFGKLSAFR